MPRAVIRHNPVIKIAQTYHEIIKAKRPFSKHDGEGWRGKGGEGAGGGGGCISLFDGWNLGMIILGQRYHGVPF